ncbi:MAG: glycosyltransferase family 39 protein [Thermomicrobiales bacterium]
MDATYQFVHPGVTVMWAGTIGYLWQYREYPNDAGGQVEWRGTDLPEIFAAHGRSALDMLVSLRLVLTFLSALVLTGAFLCAVRLLGRWFAFAGFLLIALDPFHMAHSRLLHLDGLSTNLMLLSVLAFLNHIADRRRSDLIISGVAAGLAWLTRSANLVLGPFMVLTVIIELVPLRRYQRSQFRQELLAWLRSLAVWTGIGLAVFVALWPAMWSSPIRTLELMLSGTIDLASEAHERQVFFAGEILTNDPGWHFYPLVALWRTNPVVLIGLFLALMAALLPKSFGQYLPRRPLLQLGIFAVVYALILTAGEKKLDRYLLPTQTSLDVIAGAGWVAAAFWLARGAGTFPATNRLFRYASIALVTVGLTGAVATAASARPYYINYYNPLLGGSEGAREAMMVGWGEGMDLVANELLKQPGIDELHITAGPWHHSLKYFVPSPVEKSEYNLDDQSIRQWAWTDIWVVSYPEVQRQLFASELLTFFQSLSPMATIELDGNEYAWVYDLRTAPLPDYFLESELPIVDWGDFLRYVGTRISSQVYAPGDRVNVTLYFQTLAPSGSPMRAEVRLLDPSGQVIDQDNDIAEKPDRERTIWPEVQSLTVPESAAPGTYEVVLSVTDDSTGQPLPATRAADGTPQPAEIVIKTIDVGITADESDTEPPSD